MRAREAKNLQWKIDKNPQVFLKAIEEGLLHPSDGSLYPASLTSAWPRKRHKYLLLGPIFIFLRVMSFFFFFFYYSTSEGLCSGCEFVAFGVMLEFSFFRTFPSTRRRNISFIFVANLWKNSVNSPHYVCVCVFVWIWKKNWNVCLWIGVCEKWICFQLKRNTF